METGKRPQTTEQRQTQVISRLKNKVARLEEENRIFRAENVELRGKLEKAFLAIEQLQRIVFRGKKKDKDKSDDDRAGRNKSGGKPREKESYRRPVPLEEEITGEEVHDIANCPHCQGKLTKLKILEFFTEDVLPLELWFKNLKKATKEKITTGYCPNCKKRFAAKPIPRQKVSLGRNIRELIVFQYTVQQLSYSQITDFATVCLHFHLAESEIVNILENEANQLKPVYDDLIKSIRGQPGVHFDETGWKVSFGEQGDYAWAMCGTENEDVVYLLGRSRGKGNLIELAGENYSGIGISDDYGAYKNAFDIGKHALCWAHPQRKLRDLSRSESLSLEKRAECEKEYEKYSALYAKVRGVCATAYHRKRRLGEAGKLMEEFEALAAPKPADPVALRQIKERLLEQKERYFTCVREANIPPDNNKAERALRHLVIKRKKSFGSKTQKGAEISSIIYSVVMSLWRRSKKNFFSAYALAASTQD